MDKTTEKEIEQLVSEVKVNYSLLLGEWTDLQADLKQRTDNTIKDSDEKNKNFAKGHVHVSKDDLSRLTNEITQLRQTIPSLLNKKVQSAYTELQAAEEGRDQLHERCSSLSAEVESWRDRYSVAIQDTQAEKQTQFNEQECMKLRCEIQALSQQMSQQSDYSFSLGSTCCTLLWRVSKNEDSIQPILAGTKVDEFLQLVTSTLQSFLSAYKEDWPQDGSQEMTFILALCGIVTNVAACAYGRDFLMNHSQGTEVFNTYLNVLSEAPAYKSARLKNLILMCLYNISINQKGIKYLSSKSYLPALVTWLLQEESDSELRANCLRVLQSLLLDEDNFNIVHQVSEQLPPSTLERLSRDPHLDTRDLALELISDLQQLSQK